MQEDDGKSAGLCVRSSKLHGNGVFAQNRLLAGTPLLAVTGQYVLKDDQPVEQQPHSFNVPGHDEVCLDCSQPGTSNLGRWINSVYTTQLQPNVIVCWHSVIPIVYVGPQDIPRGAELLLDYTF